TCTYLINHSLAAMPAAAEDNLREYARVWRERGIRAWADAGFVAGKAGDDRPKTPGRLERPGGGWWEMPVTVGDQLGRILGAPPDSIAMHQNVTVAEAIVLSCFARGGERNRIGYAEANFPSRRYLYQAQSGLEVLAGDVDPARGAAIDQ